MNSSTAAEGLPELLQGLQHSTGRRHRDRILINGTPCGNLDMNIPTVFNIRIFRFYWCTGFGPDMPRVRGGKVRCRLKVALRSRTVNHFTLITNTITVKGR